MADNRTILFSLPSRSRPQRCAETIRNTIDHIINPNYKILVKVDDNDPQIRKYSLFLDQKVSVIKGISTSKIHAANRDIPQEGWDILVCLSDDIRWTVKGFDDIIREFCGSDDFVVFPEPYADREINKSKNGPISVVSIMGFDYYKRDGYVYHPSYYRTHCDNEATELAMIRGRLKRADRSIFFHQHPVAGYTKFWDKQYRDERKTWATDEANYKRRKEAGYP